MAARNEAKRFGLRLHLPGAPGNYHTVQGVNGYYHPKHPTPVGEPGELPLDVARKLDRQPGVPLQLVEMTAEQASEAKAAIDAHRAENGRYLAEAVKAGGAEGQIARDEMVATAAPKED